MMLRMDLARVSSASGAASGAAGGAALLVEGRASRHGPGDRPRVLGLRVLDADPAARRDLPPDRVLVLHVLDLDDTDKLARAKDAGEVVPELRVGVHPDLLQGP